MRPISSSAESKYQIVKCRSRKTRLVSWLQQWRLVYGKTDEIFMPTVPKDYQRKSNKLRLIALIFFLYVSFFTAITKIKTCFFLHLSFYKHNFNFENDIFILVNKHNSSIVVKINLAKASFNLNLALNTWESPFKSRFRNYKSSVTPPPPPPPKRFINLNM